ncbi:uncharacterized protein LOC126853909 isoform X2 [Cataglyphis hispanica]|uniref:uncharacterized protein LOC126853909 isoform X2 n=1 Tax=Cataglyphis hispanica TaxID=1086592 RepID=UPI0021800548|nr:uncharacterized protein LOC126853909 isoform X2 [Cataglyphis hispanica]XP_050456021.1 uncharacterized protein LOC126853909 isoform X2 [Cataglyphis hispanica]XP_050456022.1 uncharacterized protein LOC126853909 isoform X2 [Cataglyphis hispanica]XP_050456023.1 uncharacterized protein LOC126853909 isoform X2 [Cataglyphis hispanica]XP_050456024.1 uncharacterized protein LOC126853909 isoform X2 [Cataglyphis hispanica]XP_050456025.1 uncharacterized protein LOC126853909 isoform X2 [Cataglyphis hisp
MDRQEFAVHNQKSSEYDDVEKKMTELFDLPGFVAYISPSDKIAYRKLQLSSQHKDLLPRGSLQESVPQKEQNKYQNDDEKKSWSRNSEHNSEKTEEEIADDSVKLNASSSVETALSGIRTDANTCQTKIQERSLSAKKSSDNAIQNSIQETKEKNSHINSSIILTNDRHISAEKSSTKVKLDSSKNKLLSKSAHNSVREFKNKSLHFKRKTISSKNICINKKHSLRNKLFKTRIRLKKHHSSSSIDSSKNNTIFKKEYELYKKEQKREIEINQEASSSKIKSLDSQEHSNESKDNDNSCERNVNVSHDTTVLNLRPCLETETNDIVDENQNIPISNTQTSGSDSELLAEQAHASATKISVKIDTQDENIKTKLTDWQSDSLPVETDFKNAVKESEHSESLDESVSTKKIQKKKEASLDRSLDENLMNDTEILDRKVFSEDKQIHDNNENEKQIFWERITQYMTKKREYRYLRQRRKIQCKRLNKIKRIRKKFRDCFQDCPSKSESDEDFKIISECLEKRNLQFVSNNTEIYDTSNDIITEEEMEDIYERDEILMHRRCESVNSLKQDSESVISQVESIDSNASTICIQNDTLHDFTTDEEMDENTDFNTDKTSTCKRQVLVDTSQEDIENVIPVKVQRIENSVLIADAETVVSKNGTDNEDCAVNVESKDVIMQDAQEDKKNIENVNIENAEETKEVNMENTQENQEDIGNINLANDVKISKDIKPNLILSTMSAQELISNIEEKDGCDVSPTVEKVFLTNNEDTMKNKMTVIADHASIMSPELEESSSNKKDGINEAFSSSTFASSKKSDINTSDDNSSIDEDNISDIEVEIKIKPKSKSRISKKFSLKAPLSVVNTCICKNLNALKSKPDILGELFQMSFKTSSETSSKNSRHGNTISSEVNEAKITSEKSSDVNQDSIAETASHIWEVICNPSHITKNNANHSSKQQQDQSSQNDTIFDKDATHHQEGNNKHVQSAEQEKMQMISENDSESAKSAFDLEKQLPKPSSNDKEKIADEQQKNPQDNIISIEDGDATKGDQGKKNECVQSVEGKGMPENNVESAKCTLDMPDLEKQPETSSEILDAKDNVRVRTSAELGSSWDDIPMNLTMNSDISIISNNTVSSASSACRSSPPSYSSATKSANHSPKSSNLFGVPADNISSNFDVTKVQDAVLNICLNFASCRKICEEQIFTEEKMNKMKINLIQIFQNIDTLKILLHMPNEDHIINYINQQKILAMPISFREFKKYLILFGNYVSIVTCTAPFRDNMYSSMPQHSNINSSVPNASASNVHAQSPYLGNISGMQLPGMQHLRAQSSTMPPPRPSINRSPPSRSTNNSSRLRQPVPNICSSNPILNPTINPQQPIGNANYLQGQRMPNVSSVNNQQFFANLGNTTSSAPPSASNINMRTYSSSNQGNTNISSTTGQTHIGTASSATAASAINMQQQNQTLYPQMPFYIKSVPYFPVFVTNQNINRINQFVHNVTQSKVCTTVNAPGNVTGNVGPGNPFVNPHTPPIPAEKNVPQHNNSVPNSVASQSARVKNILPKPSQQQQNSQQYLHQRLPNGTSISLINLTSNNVSQNAQPSMAKKKTSISETQTRDCIPNQTLFAKPQQNVHQGTPCVHNVCTNAYECVHKVSQKSSGIFTKNPVSQEPSVSQNSFNATSQRDKIRLLKSTPVPSPPNEIVNPHFNLSILTDLQKFILIDQLKFYLKKCSSNQDSQILRLERKMLVLFYESLHNYITNMMKENQVKEKLQNNASRKISKILNHLKSSKIETSCNKTQSNKTNENNSICDKVGEGQSLKKNIDLNTSINSKSMMVENNLLTKARNGDSLVQSMLKSTTINNEESSPEIVVLPKETIDTPKMRCKKNSSSFMEKQSENIKTSLDSGHANILEENSIAETSRGISETKTQDDANINNTAKSPAEKSHVEQLSALCSLLAQNTSSCLQNALSDEIKGSSKIAKNDAKKTDNIQTGNILKISNVITLNNIKENDAISQSSFNTKTQDNIINKETEKSSARDLHDKRMSESCSSPTQKTLNLQDNETKDDNVNIGGPDDAETDNICKISNVTVLNSNEGNEKTVSQVPCNTETRDKELYHNEAHNLNNKISGENSHDGMRDNEKTAENTKRSIFTEQSNTSCIPQTSTPFISDNTSKLLFPTNRSESAETSRIHIACEKYTSKTLSEFLSTLSQDDPPHKQINNSETMYDESYDESSGILHIDENGEKSSSDLQEEQHDKISSSENKPNTSQDLCLDKTRCESIEITSLSPFEENFELRLLAVKEQNIQKLNEELASKQKEIQAEEISSSEIPKDTSSTRAAMESIDTVKEFGNIKENQVQMDTHSGVKAINELLRHVSDRYNGKSRSSSCNLTMKSNATNVNETVVDRNDILNSKIISPAKSEDDHENSDIMMNILNVTSISASLFEKIDNSDTLSDDLALLNETKEKSSYANDNLEVSNSTSLSEIRVEESLNVNDNPEDPDSVLLKNIKIEESLDIDDKLKVFDSLNEIKEEKSSDVNDIPDFNSISLNETYREKSFNYNPDIYNFEGLNEMKEEKSLNNDSEVLNSASLNEIKEEKSSDVDDNLEVHNVMWLNTLKEKKSLNINNGSEVLNSTLNDMKEKKNVNNDSEVVNSSSSNEKRKEEISSAVNDNLEVSGEQENRPCLRCKRKSMVYCQACLEAPYCSKRCSDLHWKAIHYKHCKNLYKPIICIDL